MEGTRNPEEGGNDLCLARETSHENLFINGSGWRGQTNRYLIRRWLQLIALTGRIGVFSRTRHRVDLSIVGAFIYLSQKVENELFYTVDRLDRWLHSWTNISSLRHARRILSKDNPIESWYTKEGWRCKLFTQALHPATMPSINPSTE